MNERISCVEIINANTGEVTNGYLLPTGTVYDARNDSLIAWEDWDFEGEVASSANYLLRVTKELK